MFDLELKWTVGVRGKGRAKRHLPKVAVKMVNAPDEVHFIAFPEMSR